MRRDVEWAFHQTDTNTDGTVTVAEANATFKRVEAYIQLRIAVTHLLGSNVTTAMHGNLSIHSLLSISMCVCYF